MGSVSAGWPAPLWDGKGGEDGDLLLQEVRVSPEIPGDFPSFPNKPISCSFKPSLPICDGPSIHPSIHPQFPWEQQRARAQCDQGLSVSENRKRGAKCPQSLCTPSVGLQSSQKGKREQMNQRSTQLISPRHLLQELHVMSLLLSRVRTTWCSSAELFLDA